MSKPKRSTLKNKADKLFSLAVRSVGYCVNCGSTEYLQCAHGFSRRYLATRWDFRNAFCLCRVCHVYWTHRPLEWDDWLHNKWGEELYAEMRATATQSNYKPDYEAIIAELEEAA